MPSSGFAGALKTALGQGMSNWSEPFPGLSSIRGELRVLKIAVLLMIIFAALNYIAFFRLVGVPGIPPLLLLLYRGMDLTIVLVFLVFCGSRVKIKGIDFLLAVFACYPFLIGLVQGNLSITFAHDTAIFFFFIAKIIIFRTILIRISAVVDFDTVFQKFSRKLVFWSALIALILLGTATVMLARGESFYYQAPAELTFAGALLLAQGKIFAYLFFLVLALAAGKRMVMIGLLVMGLIAVLRNSRVRSELFRFAVVAVVLASLVIIFAGTESSAELTFVDKILGTFRQLYYAMEMSENFFEILMLMDPARYAEYVSLKPHLTGWSLWFGNGYGFRYELDTAFLAEFGYADGGEVTNAHFTPLAIAAKFGLLGVLIWFALIATVLTSRFDHRSFVQYASRLAFLSVIVQSFFAFSFFINFFVPFYIAMATIGARQAGSSQAVRVIEKQQRGEP